MSSYSNPFEQYLDDAGAVLSGGKLYFYLTTTSTPTPTYTDETLDPGAVNTNPIILNAAGRPPNQIFLDPEVTYKVVLKNSDDSQTFWTADPVGGSAAETPATLQVVAGDPNGQLAGNQGSVGGAGASMAWDISNFLIYVCTTTGDSSSAVWTQVGATLSGQVQFTGVISPTSLNTNQNDYNPTGLSTASIIRQNLGANVTITGLQGGAAGRVILWRNISTFVQTFTNESSSSTAAYRFALDGDLTLYPGQTVQFLYDGSSARWTVAGAAPRALVGTPGGRLTLTTAVPVLTTDVTAAATVYYTPYLHNVVPLYNGSSFYAMPFAELSQALSDNTKSPAAATSDSLYDLFVWNDAGTLRLSRGPAWSSATARGTGAGTTELERVHGRYVNKVAITNGPAAQRGLYVGTIATNGSTQLAMNMAPSPAAGGSANRLDVWNMYNRVRVQALMRMSDNTWTYTTATWRSAQGSDSNRITYVCGIAEDAIQCISSAAASNASANTTVRTGVGVDVTNAPSGLIGAFVTSSGADETGNAAIYSGIPGLGRHFLQMIEYSIAGGTTTWYGDSGGHQSGLSATFMM